MRGESHEAATLRQILVLEDVYILCHTPLTVEATPRTCLYLSSPDRLLYRSINIIDAVENIRISVGDWPEMSPTSRLLRGAGSLVVRTVDC